MASALPCRVHALLALMRVLSIHPSCLSSQPSFVFCLFLGSELSTPLSPLLLWNTIHPLSFAIGPQNSLITSVLVEPLALVITLVSDPNFRSN